MKSMYLIYETEGMNIKLFLMILRFFLVVSLSLKVFLREPDSAFWNSVIHVNEYIFFTLVFLALIPGIFFRKRIKDIDR